MENVFEILKDLPKPGDYVLLTVANRRCGRRPQQIRVYYMMQPEKKQFWQRKK